MSSKRIPSLLALGLVVLLAAGAAAYVIQRGRGAPPPGLRADTEVVVAPAQELDNDRFRAGVALFVRDLAGGAGRATCTVEHTLASGWELEARIYQAGALVGRGRVRDPSLCAALRSALRAAADAAGEARGDLRSARVVIDLVDRGYSILAVAGVGTELVSDLVAVRVVTRALLRARIQDGKEYLFRVADRQWKGVHRLHDAPSGRLDGRLHTITTALFLQTMLRLRAIDDDPRIDEHIRGSARFLLAMQSQQRDHSRGGFYHSFDLDTRRPEERLVVGTAARSIMTLLELHAYTGDAVYRDAAIRAADWLLSMQEPDGRVKAYIRRKERAWLTRSKESLLYTGQVLSALSRVYEATGDPAYGDGARRIAARFADKIERGGCQLGDDYREPNPVSSSWVVLSLLDYARATGDRPASDIARRCAAYVIDSQRRDEHDVGEGGAPASHSTSWLSAVMAELYAQCSRSDDSVCEHDPSSILPLFRQLLQRTYSAETAFTARDPVFAHGGLVQSARDLRIRTEAVAHAMNAYIIMIARLGDGPLLAVPEPPLAARLGL